MDIMLRDMQRNARQACTCGMCQSRIQVTHNADAGGRPSRLAPLGARIHSCKLAVALQPLQSTAKHPKPFFLRKFVSLNQKVQLEPIPSHAERMGPGSAAQKQAQHCID